MSMMLLRTVLLLSLAGAPLAAQAPVERTVPSGKVLEGSLSFDGRATAGNFTGATTSVTGEIQGEALTKVSGWVEAPVVTLATGNQRRDRDLNQSMESDEYPTMRFELTGIDAPGADAQADSVNVVLHGHFIIHGVTREATVPASVSFRPETTHLLADTPLNLKDYGIGGLTKMLGMLKMHEEIVVHVDLTFAGTGASSEAVR
jgi:polyisoprenoid-binding protein YceI